ncbi:transporter substrate-binding domain-containing protein [Legionella erythra]|nr:transporter substrate-binding domain-containing protein [Legionella erythra]
MRSWFKWIVCAWILVWILPAQANLKVGTVYFYPPFVTAANSGFDLDIIRIICEKLRRDCEIVPMDYHELFPALKQGTIDIAIGGITIYSKNSDKFIYSLPYMVSYGQFLIKNDSTLDTLSQLADQRIGVIRGEEDGGVFYRYLKEKFTGQFKIEFYNDMEDLIEALKNSEVTAAFFHQSTAVYWVQNGGGQFKTLGKPMSVGQGIAIVASAKNAALIEQINTQIKRIDRDNRYLSLYQTYFGSL